MDQESSPGIRVGEKGSAGCPGLLPRGEGKGSAALAPSQELVTNPVTRHTAVVFAGRNLLCLGGSFPEGWHLSPPLWMRRVPSPDTAFPLTGAHPAPPALPGASSGSGAEIHLPGGDLPRSWPRRPRFPLAFRRRLLPVQMQRSRRRRRVLRGRGLDCILVLP